MNNVETYTPEGKTHIKVTVPGKRGQLIIGWQVMKKRFVAYAYGDLQSVCRNIMRRKHDGQPAKASYLSWYGVTPEQVLLLITACQE